MDVISLGKASKALRAIQSLNDTVVAPLAEGRFSTVDARLDWIEGQASKMKVETSQLVDLSKGTFIGTELIDGKIQLKAIAVGMYPLSGTWESEIIDCGYDWVQMKTIDIVKNISATGVDVLIEVCSSSDKTTFTSYASLNASEPPQNRYIKVRATLSAPAMATEAISLDFNQLNSQNTFSLGSQTTADGQLRLKTSYSYIMQNEGALGVGTLFSQTIDRGNFKTIEKVSVV